MSRRTDTGNFVMLLLAAGLAGVFLGDWAGRAVLWLGIIGMVVGLIIYVLNSWDIHSAPTARTPPKAPGPRRRSSVDRLPHLLAAVAAKDVANIERFVLRQNLSPFQKTRWRDGEMSAMGLALDMDYYDAVEFFQAWSTTGARAHFRPASHP